MCYKGLTFCDVIVTFLTLIFRSESVFLSVLTNVALVRGVISIVKHHMYHMYSKVQYSIVQYSTVGSELITMSLMVAPEPQ